ncbi:uncharacterized protein [Physcomitrium patens]|uniref:uncharacterized protein n=1 Tax=Physcomitrium patens TaxID=3218 RepID=UPI003CCDA749
MDSVSLRLNVKSASWNGEQWCSLGFSPRNAEVANGYAMLRDEVTKSHNRLHHTNHALKALVTFNQLKPLKPTSVLIFHHFLLPTLLGIKSKLKLKTINIYLICTERKQNEPCVLTGLITCNYMSCLYIEKHLQRHQWKILPWTRGNNMVDSL